jgi:hypothetical protein
MNPTIPECVVVEALVQDESAARAEWPAEWNPRGQSGPVR